jgi:hypothetical protein
MLTLLFYINTWTSSIICESTASSYYIIANLVSFIIIMSDLAPFVAAVLRDKSNADMKEENDALRQEIDSLRCQLSNTHAVKITGPNGSPVYAHAQLEDGHVVLFGHNLSPYFVVPLPKRNHPEQQQPDDPVVVPPVGCLYTS